jgi:hypothetical protein
VPSRARLLKLIGIGVLAVLAGSWLVYERVGEGDSRPLAWRDASGSMQGFTTPRPAVGVFETAAELRDFWPACRDCASTIRFGRERAVLVTTGPRSSTGYRIDVVSVTERRRSVKVAVREHKPVAGVPRVASPVRLILIPASDKEVEVEWLERAPRGAG